MRSATASVRCARMPADAEDGAIVPSLALPDLDLAYRDEGTGPPLVLLHGWPEWSAIWRRLIPALGTGFRVIAPDLRNFGDSRGDEARDIAHYVDDLAALVDALGLERFGLVGHDVGAFLAQDYARRAPGRLAGLFVFDCPHFGIGPRWLADGHVRELWYQSFQQLPLAQTLVGASRESCRAYLAHFLSHWAGDPAAFDPDDLEEWTTMFRRPGRLAGGFRWYTLANRRRLEAMADSDAGRAPPIAVPAYSYWGSADPILKVEWQDSLDEVFTSVTCERAEGAGHFVPWERPEDSATRIAAFFSARFAMPA